MTLRARWAGTTSTDRLQGLGGYIVRIHTMYPRARGRSEAALGGVGTVSQILFTLRVKSKRAEA